MENSLGAKLLHLGLVEFGFPEELEGSHLHFHPLGLGALLDLHLLDFQFGLFMEMVKENINNMTVSRC